MVSLRVESSTVVDLGTINISRILTLSLRAMQAAGFIFLERKWERDRPHIDSLLHYFNSPEMDEPLILLLFPEGTDLTPNTKSKSDQFAEEKNLKKYDFVLHPR